MQMKGNPGRGHMDAIVVSEEAENSRSMSRSKVYDLVLSGQIESIKVGRSRRVLVAGIDDFINRLRTEQTVDDKNDIGGDPTHQ